MKKYVTIAIEIEVDMKNSSDWEDEDDFVEDEIRTVLNKISGIGKDGWKYWQTETLSPIELSSGTKFQYDTKFEL
jgi:hypothetical protein